MIAGLLGGWRRMLRIAIELAAMFALLMLADRWLTGGTGFAAVQPSPYWIPVLIVAVAYGTGAGVIAAAGASAVWLAHAHAGAQDRDYLDQLFHVSLQPLMWFVAAVGIGEVTMVRVARHVRLERRADTARRNVARLTEAFERLVATNRALQVAVATREGTTGHVVATAARLAAPDHAARRQAIAELIALAAGTEDFTCYRFQADGAHAWLRAAATQGGAEALAPALVEALRRRGGVLHVARVGDRAVLDGAGVVAIPLAGRGPDELAGCLVLHSLPFAAMTAHRIAEMVEIGGWLAPVLQRSDWLARTMRPTELVA